MRKRGGESLETPVASLIDVVFLLIIFFLVTAAKQEQIMDETIQLARAQHIQPQGDIDPRTIIINVTEEGRYNISRRQMSLRHIQNHLANVYNQYGKGVPILIRADANTEYRYVADLQDRITDTGFYRVSLAAVPGTE